VGDGIPVTRSYMIANSLVEAQVGWAEAAQPVHGRGFAVYAGAADQPAGACADGAGLPGTGGPFCRRLGSLIFSVSSSEAQEPIQFRRLAASPGNIRRYKHVYTTLPDK